MQGLVAQRYIIASDLGTRMTVRGIIVTIAVILPLFAQEPLAKDPGAFDPAVNEPARRAPLPPAGPAPHLPDGRPDFGGKGAWYPGFAGNIAETKWKGVKSADHHVDVPFLPWSLKLFNERVENIGKDDPEARCLPVGVPRYMFDPYPFQMIQTGGPGDLPF